MDGNIEHHDGRYSFPLFSRKATSQHGASMGRVYQTINLRSSTPPTTSPDSVIRNRPTTYYFTGIPTREITEQYQQTAVTGEEVMKYGQTKWPGSQVSWRVTTVGVTGADIATKKKRSGKKRRMLIRAKFLVRELEVMAARQALADKERAWKENRARKNRKNKLKRRAKDRPKKVQGMNQNLASERLEDTLVVITPAPAVGEKNAP